MKIIFFCVTCQNKNKHGRGNEGYEMKEIKFGSFSDAVNHLIKMDREDSYQHDMHMVIKNE